jgi:putative nucleotidyltransferase with HDIG domain
MPAFPASVQQVIALTSDINSSPKDLVKVIDHDPVLTMKILKVANSAYFGLSRKIVSINHAVVYLGLNTVKHVALAIAAIGSLPRENDADFDMDNFLLHSLTTAVLTRSLARQLRIPEIAAANFFVTGLLHDIGQVVYAQFRPAEFKKALECARNTGQPLQDLEEKHIGHNHSEVGAVLCESWDFPEDMVVAIRMHHRPGTGRTGGAVRQCLFLANQLSARITKPTNSPAVIKEDDLPPWIFRTFGNDFDTIIQNLTGFEADLQEATSLLQMDSQR